MMCLSLPARVVHWVTCTHLANHRDELGDSFPTVGALWLTPATVLPTSMLPKGLAFES
jgi:hypothetical protein